MRFFNRLVQKVLFPVRQYVSWRMMFAILTALSDEKIRLYAVRNRGLSLHRPIILPTWYGSKKAIMKRKPGQEIVYVDIPMSLLFEGGDPVHDTTLHCSVYTLKGTGLRFAKRSYRRLRMA
ncbi:hypothetical protein ABEV74_14595 [Paenibacillus cisolokensis]|uniref:hypothetical protein n=1 Tax=Paenibacillus cisolokensis TaxID=1658519 RepID=UPI003D2CB9DF